MNKPLMLLIRDGWGMGKGGPGDAVAAANTPNMDRLLATYPMCTLDAAGEPVGVRDGSMGSSEVGHLNMGAGRIVEQEIMRVDRMMRDGSFYECPRLVEAIAHVKSTGGAFHMMGLIQDQGVHAHNDHLYAMLDHLASQGVKDVVVHFFADGRDTPQRSALTFLEPLEAKMAEAGVGRIGTVIGRYWAMDRGENWDRTEKAYRTLAFAEGDYTATSAREAIESAYVRADAQTASGDDICEVDEFICPTIIVDDAGSPVGKLNDGDALLHMNYRQDRAYQLTLVFAEKGFDKFDPAPMPDVFYMGITRYYDEFELALVPPMNMAHLLGEVLAENNKRQLRIAEFQKFRHVTSFFNGKLVEPYAGEDRIEVESITIPENQQPEMSAYEVTPLVVAGVTKGIAAGRQAAIDAPTATLQLGGDLPGGCPVEETYDAIMLNFANCDMVGHTGVFEAAVKSVEAVDTCIGKVVDAVLSVGGTVLITADHGNAEQMVGDDGCAQTAHTTNLVEFVYVADDHAERQLVEHGKLSDIAVTMLDLMGIEKPAEMTANTLLKS